jgi:2-phospho-L-lactate guanylyltransferase
LNIFAVIPVKTLSKSKRRLASVLTVEERVELCKAMLIDVLNAVGGSKVSKVIVVTKDPEVERIARRSDAVLIREEEERGVNSAVSLADEICRDSDASIVVPQDLPFAQPSDHDMLCNSAVERRCVVITPSQRYDGTNVLLRKPSHVMETHYDEDSYKIHVLKARERKIPVKLFLNKRLMFDIDQQRDVRSALSTEYKSETLSYLLRMRKRLGTNVSCRM